MRPRHTDTDLLELAREGSAPAFASLLHRHRDVLQRGALRTEHPERTAEQAMTAAVRRIRRGSGPDEDLRGWLTDLVEHEVVRDPGRPGVERLLPSDWFDRVWVRVAQRWPSGRRRPRPPRWALQLLGVVLLGALGSVTAYAVITADASSEILSELIADPIEDPDVLVVPGPVIEAVEEEAPELFGDVELGELPTYDLTGEGDRRPAAGPTLGPPRDQSATDPEPDAASGTDD